MSSLEQDNTTLILIWFFLKRLLLKNFAYTYLNVEIQKHLLTTLTIQRSYTKIYIL